MVGNPKGFGGRVLPMEGKVGERRGDGKSTAPLAQGSTNGYQRPYTPFSLPTKRSAIHARYACRPEPLAEGHKTSRISSAR